MTREEAINLIMRVFDTLEGECNIEYDWSKEHKARDMAIKTLEQEPCEDAVSRQDCINAIENTDCELSPQAWEEITTSIMLLQPVIPKQDSVLDKIRAEIEALPKTYPFVNHFDMYVKEDDVKRIIDKYKAESESK